MVFFLECDIPYIPPSEYQAAENEEDKNKKNGNGFYVDPYEQIVSSNLKLMDKQKVRSNRETGPRHDFGTNFFLFLRRTRCAR